MHGLCTGIVLSAAGVTSVQKQMVVNIILGVFNLCMATAGSLLCDKLGRKFLLCKLFVHLIIYTAIALNTSPSAVWTTIAIGFFLGLCALLTALYGQGSNASGQYATVGMLFLGLGTS